MQGEAKPQNQQSQQANAAQDEAIRAAITALLLKPAGEITSKAAWEYAGKIIQDREKARMLARQLLSAASLSERLLGVYILMEIPDGRTEALQAAAKDPSPHVRAMAADQLFLKEEFHQWERFVADMVANQATDIDGLVSPYDLQPAKPELPAGLALLNLDQGLDAYTIEMLARNAAVAAVARRQVLDENQNATRRTALLDLLNEANPPGQDHFLREFIAGAQTRSEARWNAIVRLANHDNEASTVSFLRGLAEKDENDPLVAKIEEAAERIEARMQSGAGDIDTKQKLLSLRVGIPGVEVDRELRRQLSTYLDYCAQHRDYRPDAVILAFLQQQQAQIKVRSYAADRARAWVDYLIWREGQR